MKCVLLCCFPRICNSFKIIDSSVGLSWIVFVAVIIDSSTFSYQVAHVLFIRGNMRSIPILETFPLRYVKCVCIYIYIYRIYKPLN